MTTSDYPHLSLGGYETYQLAQIATFIADSLARHRQSPRGLLGRAERADAVRDLALGRNALDTVRRSAAPTSPHDLPRPIDAATFESAAQLLAPGQRRADVVALASSGSPTWAVLGHVPGLGRVGAVVSSPELAAGLRTHFLTRPLDELISWSVTDRVQQTPTLPDRVDLVRAVERLDPRYFTHREVADALRGPNPYLDTAVQRRFANAHTGPVRCVPPVLREDGRQRADHERGPVRDQPAPVHHSHQGSGKHQQNQYQQ